MFLDGTYFGQYLKLDSTFQGLILSLAQVAYVQDSKPTPELANIVGWRWASRTSEKAEPLHLLAYEAERRILVTTSDLRR